MVLSAKYFRQALIWLAVCIALYGAAVLYEGWDEVSGSIAQLGWSGWLAVLGLSLVNIVLRFIRWQYYLQRLGYHVPALLSFAYMLCGFAFTSTPAKAGEAVRSLYLKKHGVGYTRSLAALFVERLTDLIAVVLLALMAALVDPDLRWPVIVAGGALLLLLPLVHSAMLQRMLAWLATLFKAELVTKGVDAVLKLLRSASDLLKSGPLYGGMVLSMGAAFAVSLTMYVVLTILGVEIPMYLAIGIYATGILAGALSFLPGGIGSAELVMLGLLLIAGVDNAVALSAILICRVAGMWFPVALGMLSIFIVEAFTSSAGEDGATAEQGERHG